MTSDSQGSFFLFLFAVLIAAAYAACAILTLKCAHLRDKFLIFGLLIAMEALARTLPIIDGITLGTFGYRFTFYEPSCSFLWVIGTFILSVRPVFYLGFIYYTLEKHCCMRAIVYFCAPGVVTAISFVFLINILFIYQYTCELRDEGLSAFQLFLVAEQVLDYVNLLFLIGSLFLIPLKHPQSLHRRLLLTAVIGHIPENGVFHVVPLFGEYLKLSLALVFPITFYLTTEKQKQKREKIRHLSTISSNRPDPLKISGRMRSYAFMLLMHVPIIAAHAACAMLTLKSAHRRRHFELFAAMFTAQAVDTTLFVLDYFLQGFHKKWIRSHAIFCNVLSTNYFFLSIIMPMLFLWFILHTLFGQSAKGRMLCTRIIPSLLGVASLIYLIFELLRDVSFCSTRIYTDFGGFVMKFGVYTEFINVILLIASFFFVHLNKTQSIHRLLLLLAAAVEIPDSMLLYEVRPSFYDHGLLVTGTWYSLPLIYPIAYYFVTRKHDMEENGKEEERSPITESMS